MLTAILWPNSGALSAAYRRGRERWLARPPQRRPGHGGAPDGGRYDWRDHGSDPRCDLVEALAQSWQRVFTHEGCRAVTRAVLAEGAAVAAAIGCKMQPDADGQIRNGSALLHKTSILQDYELGRPMEIDAFYTVLLEMARANGVATPTLDMLVAILVAMAPSERTRVAFRRRSINRSAR